MTGEYYFEFMFMSSTYRDLDRAMREFWSLMNLSNQRSELLA